MAAYPPIIKTGISAATGTAGAFVYQDSTSTSPVNQLTLTDANVVAQAGACDGMLLGGCTAGQGVSYIASGAVNVGAVLTKGKFYCLSATNAGGLICLDADQVSGWYSTMVGWAYSTSILIVSIQVTGVALT